MVMQEPVGVVAAFTPWNFPTLTPVRKIAGALAAGCSIIIKASEETPGGCVELVKCFADAGVPAGVLNLVFGVPANVSEHLIAVADREARSPSPARCRSASISPSSPPRA